MRRWVAEGLISRREGPSALDTASHCFDALVAQRFILPEQEVRPTTRKSKSFYRVHELVGDFLINWLATYDYSVDPELPPDMAQRLSIQKEIEEKKTDLTSSYGIMELLVPTKRSVPYPLHLLNVLDLEGCRGLKKKHLKIICKKVSHLRYLGLKDTDIPCLPKHIHKLQQLETLDIRKTKVRESDTKYLMLPLLKCLYAGCIIKYTSGNTSRSNESLETVQNPREIGRMTNMEVLSHVKVSNGAEELLHIRNLKLKKLGVILYGKRSNMKYLFNQIEKMDKCLRSLSIWIEGPSNDDHADDPMLSLLSPPKFLQSLSISGTGALLTRWIGKLGQLSKLSLRETCLSDNDFVILGNLGCLCYLRLRYVSFEGSVLTFTNGAFMNLIILDIEDKEIRKLIFQYGATPKLEKLVWSCKCMESPEGLEDLQSLREFELNGVSQDIGIMQKDSIELCSFQDGGNGSKEKMLHKALNRKGGERIPSKKKIPFRNKVWQKIQFKL